MPLVDMGQAGQIGVNQDLSITALPPNAWTDALNVRFIDGKAENAYGYDEIYATPPVIPYHLRSVLYGDTKYLLMAGIGKIYAVNGGVYTDLTRTSGGDYLGSHNTWTSTVLSGIPILNDGSGLNYPQSWDLNIAGAFQNLANWPASTYCKSIRSFKNYLFALNVTKGATNYPYLVKWSSPADPGAVPSTWDESDASNDAGEFDLAEGGDYIIDGLACGDSFLIYKSASVWRVDFTGGPYVFSFRKVGGPSGLISRNCIAEIDGNHFIVTTSDVGIHNGQVYSSVLDKKTRRALFADIDKTYVGRSFVTKNPYAHEVIYCYPSTGNSVPNKGLVYNWREQTVTFCELPSIHHADAWFLESGLSNSWDSDGTPWDADLTTWDETEFIPDAVRCVMAADSQKLFLLDSSTTQAGVLGTAYLERKGLDFGNPASIKLVRGIRPKIDGNTGYTVTISVGSQDDPYEAPTYTNMTHTIGTTISDDCLVSGRYISIKFATGTSHQWNLDNYHVDVEHTGAW